MNKIKIQVSGPPCSGKSTVIALICEALANYNFMGSIADTETQYDQDFIDQVFSNPATRDTMLSEIAKRTEVVITEIQTRKTPFSSESTI